MSSGISDGHLQVNVGGVSLNMELIVDCWSLRERLATRMPIQDQYADTPNGAMIAVHDLRKAIGDEEILRGVDLDVAVGETLAIIGRSGGGKSVLLKHLIGLMQPDAGEIWVAGKNITGMGERQLTSIRQKVGILFQSGALFDSMTVEENIAFPATRSRYARCEGDARARQ